MNPTRVNVFFFFGVFAIPCMQAALPIPDAPWSVIFFGYDILALYNTSATLHTRWDANYLQVKRVIRRRKTF
jgi:hypothetical protein